MGQHKVNCNERRQGSRAARQRSNESGRVSRIHSSQQGRAGENGRSGRPRQIQHQQPLENFFIRQVCRVVLPLLSGSHSNVQHLVRGVQPGRTLVVELGQRALGQVFFKAMGLAAIPSGITSSTRSVHSGRFSQASHRSLRRLAARAMASACGRTVAGRRAVPAPNQVTCATTKFRGLRAGSGGAVSGGDVKKRSV